VARKTLVECEFYIPLRRDSILSDGAYHEIDAWEWLQQELWDRFLGATFAPGIYRGFYADPDTGEKVDDESQKFIVALPRSNLDVLRSLLAEACNRFQQKCIYLSISGMVEFVEARK
jgi:hypothetical protein